MTAKHLLLTLLVALLVVACAPATEPPAPTPDVNAVSTAAAETVFANIAATVAAASPTPFPTATATSIPLPTDTLTPTAGIAITLGAGTSGPLCEVFQFIADMNLPDDSEVTAGSDFVKTWKVRNVGACAWGAGYQLAYAGYTDKMGGVPQALSGVIQPGQEVEVSVQFKAPTKAGVYVSAWTMANPQGISFFDIAGKPFYVKVVVR